MSTAATTGKAARLAPLEIERHYTPQEIAGAWGLSKQTIVRMFEKEPGVLVVQNSRIRSLVRKRTLRIPQSVLERVHRKREVT